MLGEDGSDSGASVATANYPSVARNLECTAYTHVSGQPSNEAWISTESANGAKKVSGGGKVFFGGTNTSRSCKRWRQESCSV